MEKMLRVGTIVSTHGLRGEVKVFPTTDDPSRFEDLDEVWVQTKTGPILMHVKSVRYFKQFVLLTFKGIDKIEDVEPYIKKDLLVDREHAVELEEDEYFVADLIGLTVGEEDDHVLGKIKDVFPTGANDVYVVYDGEKEILLPAIHQCILKVDLEEGKMTVHVPEGLL